MEAIVDRPENLKGWVQIKEAGRYILVSGLRGSHELGIMLEHLSA
jgi:hypothetical protein